MLMEGSKLKMIISEQESKDRLMVLENKFNLLKDENINLKKQLSDCKNDSILKEKSNADLKRFIDDYNKTTTLLQAEKNLQNNEICNKINILFLNMIIYY